jgi:hypothetical protein
MFSEFAKIVFFDFLQIMPFQKDPLGFQKSRASLELTRSRFITEKKKSDSKEKPIS